MTLSALVQKYGAAGKRLTYAHLIREITARNTEVISRGLGRLSVGRYRDAAKRALRSGKVKLPEWDEAVSPRAYFLRKAQQNGEIITDTLRRRLTKSLRDELASMPATGRVDPKALRRLESKVREAMSSYSGGDRPPNAHTIAVTEARTAYDEVKYEYARKLALANPQVSLRKRWIHNGHLVKEPREHHEDLNGVTVGFYESFTVNGPDGVVQMNHPHDPHAPIGEVAGCQCDYDVEVIPVKGSSRVGKSLDGLVMKDRGPVPKVGDVVTRKDGSKWVKTGTFSYRKATKDEEASGKAAPGSEGSQDAGPKKAESKAPSMTSDQAWAILDRVGRGGFWNLTKDGLNELLKAEGLDPSKMKFEDKKKAVYEAMDRKRQKDKEENTVRVPKLKPYGNPNMEVRDVSEERAEFLIKHAPPTPGGHWGSAESTNNTAVHVALSSGTRWRPIDKVEGGELTDYRTQVFSSDLVKAAGMRNYAQDRIKSLPREQIPNFFRGMTLDPKSWEAIKSGESDTIELTGCTAFSCYEKIADRYSKSNWTMKFGRERKPVKIVLERDDDVDDSIGMWHQTFNEKNTGREDPAFELLSGLEAIRVVSVNPGKSKDEARRDLIKRLQKEAGLSELRKAKKEEEYAEQFKIAAQERQEKADYYEQHPEDYQGYSTPIQKMIETIRDQATGYKKREEEARSQARKLTDEANKKKSVAVGFDFLNPKYESVFINYISIAAYLWKYQREGKEGETLREYAKAHGTQEKDLNLMPDVDRNEARSITEAFDVIDYNKYYHWNRKYVDPPMVLHCVAGRGKKSVTGGDEGIEEEKKDGN